MIRSRPVSRIGAAACRALRLAALALFGAALSAPAAAEWRGGTHVLIGVPGSPLSDVSGTWIGASVHATRSLSSRLHARAVLQYGSTLERTMLVPPERTGGSGRVELAHGADIGAFGIGPEVRASTGPIRPYAFGTAGLGWQRHRVRFQGSLSGANLPPPRDAAAWGLSWSLGGGVLLPIRTGERRTEMDLGVEYRVQSDARWTAVEDVEPGEASERARSAPLVEFRLGISQGW